ncbi:MAG: DUF1287 domain-containing protein [Methylacidiphilales bacterium]|nr:DUF1287 domain-containing protein [Candidatus Methylacidiphilales bacterium]
MSRATLLAFFVGAAGILPAQVNPSPPETVVAKRAALTEAALAEVGVTTMYDPSYVKLAYPGGDVPMDRGVCTDGIIRALRQVGADLQVLVQEDEKKAPAAYPHDWGHVPPDPNIDHRRVPNLMVLFKREGRQVPASKAGTDYLPGDIVVWRLPSGLLHVGLVTGRLAPGTNRPLMVHNIGQGAQCEDVLFAFTLVGHYRWFL